MSLQGLTKIVTRKAGYDCHLLPYKGKITEIIKMEKGNKINFETIPSTSNFQMPYSKEKDLRKNLRTERGLLNQSSMEAVYLKKSQFSVI
jgi:hypothetical protein